MSTLRVDTIQNAAGTDSPISVPGTAKAWVNFNGTGTVAIRASYNVSSITDNGTGDYTVNFTAAMTDANYAAVMSGQYNTTGGSDRRVGISRTASAVSSGSVRVVSHDGAGNSQDFLVVCVSIFR